MPYLIRENFLRNDTLGFVLNEIKRLKYTFSRKGYNNKTTIRDLIDPRYCGTQYISNPRNILHSVWSGYFWDETENDLWGSKDSGFIHSCFIRSGKVLLSTYSDGDYYGRHIDIDMGNIITAVLMLNFHGNNHKFTGGDLVLQGTHLIPFNDNTLVVFPACMEHEVTKIKLDGTKYEDQRFSLQYFVNAVSFKNKLIDESSSIE